jgi:hypothetical protein
MFACALVSGIVIEIVRVTETKRSILLATLRAEHFRLLRPASSGRRSHGMPTRPRLARRRRALRASRWRTGGHVWPAPRRGRRRDRGE